MRLTDEDVRRHKENKYSVECVKGKVKMSDGDIVGNLCDTIAALQQEYTELDAGHSKLFKAYCGVKQENEQLRNDNINAEINLMHMIDLYTQLQAQNGAMVEALKQAREAFHYFCSDPFVFDKQRFWQLLNEAIVAIDKIGGREDV